MSKLLKAMLMVCATTAAIGWAAPVAAAEPAAPRSESRSALSVADLARWTSQLPTKQIRNATMFGFKGQCTTRSDCGVGTWSCCNTSCEPVAKCP